MGVSEETTWNSEWDISLVEFVSGSLAVFCFLFLAKQVSRIRQIHFAGFLLIAFLVRNKVKERRKEAERALG